MNRLSEEIAKVAYELYEKRGRGHGQHFDDWLEAERIVMARHAKSAEKTGKSPVKKRTSTRTSKEKTPERAKVSGKPTVRKKRSAPPRTS